MPIQPFNIIIIIIISRLKSSRLQVVSKWLCLEQCAVMSSNYYPVITAACRSTQKIPKTVAPKAYTHSSRRLWIGELFSHVALYADVVCGSHMKPPTKRLQVRFLGNYPPLLSEANILRQVRSKCYCWLRGGVGGQFPRISF